MNQIIFQAYVSVPNSVIKEIGEGIRRLVVAEMTRDRISYNTYRTEEIERFGKLIDDAAVAYADAAAKSCEGYNLSHKKAKIIANEMRNGRKIMAIKDFRMNTGAGLKEAKDIIDSFGCTENGALQFLAAFM